MAMMTKEDILHLADLARITVSPDEIEQLQGEINDIVSYVSTVQSLTTEVDTKQLGARFNVMRADEVSNKPGQYTADLLAAAPATDERGYLKVQQILDQDKADS